MPELSPHEEDAGSPSSRQQAERQKQTVLASIHLAMTCWGSVNRYQLRSKLNASRTTGNVRRYSLVRKEVESSTEEKLEASATWMLCLLEHESGMVSGFSAVVSTSAGIGACEERKKDKRRGGKKACFIYPVQLYSSI